MNSLKQKPLTKWLAAGFLILFSLLITSWTWVLVSPPESIEAPEAEKVLQSQAVLPFQILIPAYLPAGFQRKDVQIKSDLTGSQGQEMVVLVYAHPLGVTLTLNEWIPAVSETTGQVSGMETNVQRCSCLCGDHNQCSANRLMVDNGSLRVMGETSDPELLSPEHVRVILTTLAPAGGLLTHSTLEKVPVDAGLPPAEEVPVNASGVQEVVLVVASGGYSPVHFSIKKDVPVRLVFRQLGEVGCGNELYFQWGAEQSEYLVLSGPGDSRVLEFTPHETGQLLFHCPHFIYQGVVTITD